MRRKPRPVPRANSLPDIGLISIPVLCCLLGAAFFVYVFGGQRAPWNAPFLELQDKLEETATATTSLDEREDEALGRALLLKRAEEIRRLTEEVRRLSLLRDDLTAKVADLAELARLQLELDRLREELERLRIAEQNLLARQNSVFGGYTGNYVLIECVQDAIIVHPGAERIGLYQLPDTQDRLMAQIVAAGYVAFAVRPSGWHENSFSRVKTLVYERLSTTEQSGGARVGRAEFPLHEADPIEPYLPSET